MACQNAASGAGSTNKPVEVEPGSKTQPASPWVPPWRGPDEKRLNARTRDVAIANGQCCPECGSKDTESNGHTEYRCRECDHRWGYDFGERYGF